MKLYTHEEMLNRHFGGKGTPRRDKFEKDIQGWIIGEAIKQTRIKRQLTKNNFSRFGRKRKEVSTLRKLNDKNKTMEEALILMVSSAEYVGGHTIICIFNNGERRKVDFTPLLKYPAYKELQDVKEFERYGVDGTIFWANGADIAPEWLYEHGTPC